MPPIDTAAPIERDRAPAAGLADSAAVLVESGAQQLRAVLAVAGHEARLAGLSLSTMLSLSITIGVLAVSAWLLLALAIVAGLDNVGFDTEWGLAAFAAINAAGAWLIWRHVKSLSSGLSMPLTRTVLHPEARDADEPPSA